MLNLNRLTGNHASRTLAFFVGLRKAESTVTPAEHALLVSLSRGKRCIVEVGVFEGVTSRVFCDAMDPGGRLYLVDPFFPETSIEKLLNVSFTRWVAAKSVSAFERRSEFVRKPSSVAATSLPVRGKAELVFIDARHDYDSVLEDFRCWAPLLASGAAIAFHDSRMCAARPDLTTASGPVQLMNEIASGQHGPWTITDTADSVTVVRRRSDIALAS